MSPLLKPKRAKTCPTCGMLLGKGRYAEGTAKTEDLREAFRRTRRHPSRGFTPLRRRVDDKDWSTCSISSKCKRAIFGVGIQ